MEQNKEKQLELFNINETLSYTPYMIFDGVEYVETDTSVLEQERDKALSRIKEAWSLPKEDIDAIKKTFLECSKKAD